MSSSNQEGTSEIKYKGVRRRRWGKFVSEIRVPGTQERLWLGSYATPEAAAVAHDVAFYCLRKPSSFEELNFPQLLPANVNTNMSPKSVQKAASDAGMAIDAQLVVKKEGVDEEDGRNGNRSSGGTHQHQDPETTQFWVDMGEGYGRWPEGSNESREGEGLSISVEDYL